MGRQRGGVSRQVRKTTLSATPHSTSSTAQLTKTSYVLGFKAKAAEHQLVRERVRQEYAGDLILAVLDVYGTRTDCFSTGLNVDGREILQQIQQASGTYLEGEIPLPDAPPISDDNLPIDESDGEQTEETTTVVHAARDMRLSLL